MSGMRGITQNYAAAAFQNIIKLRGTFVVVTFGTVNVHGMHPGCRRQRTIFVTEQPVAPAAGTTLALRMPLMTNQNWT